MNKKEFESYIEYVSSKGSKLGLDLIRELLKRLGEPQNTVPVIHVAGTNGKGSVVNMLSSILGAHGYKCGVYTSPVTFTYLEKIKINKKNITWGKYIDCIERIKEICMQMEEDGWDHPSIFEIETAAAFLFFSEASCDLIVLETGLGGNLDATNVVKNTFMTVFTSISMDHMEYLGTSLKEIAEKKAGILREKTIALSTWQEREVAETLINQGKMLNVKILFSDKDQLKIIKTGFNKQEFKYKNPKKYLLNLGGIYQFQNATLVLDCLEQLTKVGYSLNESTIRKVLNQITWPGRMEIICKRPMFLIDGAHNEDAAKKLGETLRSLYRNKRIIFILGMFKDKEIEKIIGETYSYAEEIITVGTTREERSLSSHDLAELASKYHPRVTEASSLEEAVEISFLLAEKDSIILAFGSLSNLNLIKKAVQKHAQNMKKIQ